jgi:hypothetical protein
MKSKPQTKTGKVSKNYLKKLERIRKGKFTRVKSFAKQYKNQH